MKLELTSRTQVETAAGNKLGLVAALEVMAASSGIALVVATLAWQTRHHFITPLYDGIFDRLRLYRALPSISSLIDYFVSAHNEHRILTTRLFAFVDEFVFSGREHSLVVATNTFQLCSAWVVYRGAFASEMGKTWGIAEKLFAFFTIALFFVNPNFLYTLIVPFQLQHAIMTFVCVTSACLVGWASVQIHEDRIRRLIPTLIALALVATFTLGNAPAILIATATTAVVLHWRPRVILVLGTAAIGHTAAVFVTTTPVGAASHDVLQMLKFSLIYYGAPFLRFAPWPSNHGTWWSSVYLASGFGVVVLGAAFAFAILRIARPGIGGATAVFGFMLLMMVIVTGLAAAHSRAQFGILEAANKKYASFAALGWLGVLAVASGVARHLLQGLGRRTEMAVFALALAVVLPLGALGYTRETRIWHKAIDRVGEAGIAAFLQINDRNQLRNLYTEEPGLGEYLDYVSISGRALFSHFPFRWGDSGKAFLTARRKVDCLGEIEALTSIPASDLTSLFQAPGSPVSISGWAWMNEDRGPPALIFVIDSKDRIVGAARITRASARAEEWLGQKLSQDVGWFGFARIAEPAPLLFHGLSGDGKRFCLVGESRSIQ